MPEINIRAGQQEPEAKRVGPDELSKLEYRLRQFFRKQEEDVYVQMGKQERIRQSKVKEVVDAEIKARRQLVNDAYRENAELNSQAKKARNQQQQQEKQEYAEAHKINRQMDSEKRRTEKAAADKAARDARQDAENKRREFLRIHAEASRDDRKLEQDKNREAREMYADASRDNRTFDQDKRRAERERLRADERSMRDAMRDAEREAEYKRTHGFLYGAALGGGVTALASAFVGGSAPSRILGVAGGAVGGGLASAAGYSPKSVGIIAEVIGLATQAGFELNKIVNSITEEYQNYRVTAMDLSRAALQPGEGAYNAFYPGYNKYDPRMMRVGLGPQQALQSLMSLGVVPTDQSQYVDLATTMRAFSISSAFVGMKPGTVEGLVGQAMGQGNIPSTGAGTGYYLNTFARIMEEATGRGMDRSKLLEQMQGSMDIVAKSNALGVNAEAIQDLTFRMMQSGIQGGRTGQAAADITAGITGTMSNIMGNKLSSTMLMTQLPQFGNLKTAAGVQAFAGNRAWAASGATPEGAAHRDFLVQMATGAANIGNMPLAMQYAMEIAKADVGRLPQLLAGPLGLASGGYSPLLPVLLSQAENISLAEATAQVGQFINQTGPGISGRQVTGLLGQSGRGMGVAGSMMTFDPNITDSVYLARLQAMGVSPDAAKAILEGAKQSNTNPYMLAAIGKAESGNNPNQGWNDPRISGGKRVSFGPMQINQMNWAQYPGGGQFGAPNYAAGGRLFQDLLRQSHGNIEEALARYRGKLGTPIGAAYAQEVEQTFGQLQGTVSPGTSGGFPGAIYESQYKADYQGIQTAAMFSVLIDSANALSMTLDDLAAAAKGVIANMGGSGRPSPVAGGHGAQLP